jgi:integrase
MDDYLSSRREEDEFLIHAIHSKRCTEQGIEGGFHAFRRFRFSVLRRTGVPENLIKQWLGHSQNLMDLYAAQLQYDVAYRREWRETAGLGFELGELGYKLGAPIRPSLVA